MPAHVEAVVIGLRTNHRTWGARRIVHELGTRALAAAVDLPSESGVYRALRRAGLIEPGARRRRREVRSGGSGPGRSPGRLTPIEYETITTGLTLAA